MEEPATRSLVVSPISHVLLVEERDSGEEIHGQEN
jgi:hypothetical protein